MLSIFQEREHAGQFYDQFICGNRVDFADGFECRTGWRLGIWMGMAGRTLFSATRMTTPSRSIRTKFHSSPARHHLPADQSNGDSGGHGNIHCPGCWHTTVELPVEFQRGEHQWGDQHFVDVDQRAVQPGRQLCRAGDQCRRLHPQFQRPADSRPSIAGAERRLRIGTFTDWTTSGNFDYCAVNSDYVHSGVYWAELGPEGTPGYLSQTLATTVGQMYLVSCWLYCDGYTPNEFSVSWNGTTLFDQQNIGATLLDQPSICGQRHDHQYGADIWVPR